MRLIGKLRWLVLLLLCHAAVSDDTDIYLDGSGRGDPWVHVLLDLRGAHSPGGLCTYGIDCGPPFLSARAHGLLAEAYSPGDKVGAAGILRVILAAIIDNPRFDHINLSLLIPNHPGNPAGSASGGTGGGSLLAGYQRLGESRESLLETLHAIPLDAVPPDHALQPKEAFYEWYRYVNGGQVALGTNTSGNFGEASPYPDYDGKVIDSGRYMLPFTDPDACPRLYGIVGLLGPAGADADLDDLISRSLSLPPGGGFEDMLALMSHPATDLLSSTRGTVPLTGTLVIALREQAETAARYARAGGGEAVLYLDQPREVEQGLAEFIDRVLSANASFVSASIAVDPFEQGALLDRLYLGLFQPSGGVNWSGNVKKYRMLADQGIGGRPEIGAIVDMLGGPAFESEGPDRGKIAFNALSFWTDRDTLPPGDGVITPTGVDGREVARGGAGQKIDGFVDYLATGQRVIGDTNDGDPPLGETSRQVYVEPPVPGEFMPFNADSQTVDLVGDLLDPDAVYNRAERLALIRWGRGQDVDSGTASARRWLLGDVLHSRPLALNYGATSGYTVDNPQVHLFFGSGDGMLHILEDVDREGRQSGRERFAFYPRELLRNIAILRERALPAQRRPYGVDGEPVALRVDRDQDGTIEPGQGDEAYVYVGLRRGGSSYFALDVSDPDTPPRLAWKLGPGGDFSELGLSFSTPVVGRVKFEQSARDVLIFGAGYHGGWNEAGTARIGKDLGAEDDPVGNAIYIVDARTGDLVWKAVRGTTGSSSNRHYEHAALVDSIPSSVAVQRTAGGLIHRLYVGDTGGALWRVDLPPGDAADHRRDNWFVTKLADLGADAIETGGSASRDLRFFHPPEIVRSFDGLGAFDGVLIQSGDRAHPNETTSRNYLFYLKDREVVSGADNVRAENDTPLPTGRLDFADLGDQTDCVRGTEADPEGLACRESPLPMGWKLRFERPGEKGLSRPLVDAGRVFATTYTPATDDACAPREGQGHLYALKLADASALVGGVRVRDLGAGIPADPVYAGDTILLPGGGAGLYDFDGDGRPDNRKLLPSETLRRYRVYWREPGMDPL